MCVLLSVLLYISPAKTDPEQFCCASWCVLRMPKVIHCLSCDLIHILCPLVLTPDLHSLLESVLIDLKRSHGEQRLLCGVCGSTELEKPAHHKTAKITFSIKVFDRLISKLVVQDFWTILHSRTLNCHSWTRCMQPVRLLSLAAKLE